MICSFVIYIVGLVAHVRIRRVERIRVTAEWLEREMAEDLAALRFIVSSPEISRELWIYTPKGTFRFFLVLANSLTELDRNGQLMPDQPAASARKSRAASGATAPAGRSGEEPAAPEPADIPAGSTASSLPVSTPGSVSNPIVVVGENPPPDHEVGEMP